ncbi:hypothetical protein FRC03_008481 [Tulasnella sp. 419]|nr:hypothetical protein FRC03_008481 [Tulasnella sp. 419]
MAYFGGASTSQQPTTTDVELTNPPSDSISALSFSPQADYLAVASWDNEVRIYAIGPNGQSEGKAMYKHEGPVLDVCWSADGAKIFSGGADKAARMFDLNTQTSSQVASHDAPVKCVRWINAQGGILITGSWDKTLKYWDTRSPNPIAVVQLPERCYTMDVAHPLLVVGTAERHILAINLNNPSTIYKSIVSPLKWQTRSVGCFPTGDGYAVGSVEGRIAIQYIEEKDSTKNFSFKCHRKDAPNPKDGTNIFSVNNVIFHQGYGTFCTAGADGMINFWDKDSKTRLKSLDQAPGPISCIAFNRSGTILAYAVSYDWSKGHTGNVPGHVNKVMLHPLKDEEVKRKPK